MNFKGTPVNWPLPMNMIRRGMENHTFGNVRRNADGTPRPHQGWDFFAEPGTPVMSISDGVVKFAGARGSLGNLLVISIGNTGYFAAYAHLQELRVKVGDQVEIGQTIALTGITGNASTMKGQDQHLHFEVREQVLTGLGLDGRISPMKVFGTCPLKAPIQRGPSG